jgi:DNA ligase 1
MDLNNIYEVMTEIANESSKTGKEAILKANEGNDDFRQALVFLLNPYIVTGLSTKKINKKIKLDPHGYLTHIKDFDKLIEYIKSFNSGRDTDIETVQWFISSLESDELKTFVKKFITKTLKLGISEKTVNKVYGKGTIPSFAVMLAEPFSKKADKITGDFYVTLKLDGNRCVAIREGNSVKFFTRKGIAIEGMKDLEEQFLKLPPNVYDGELLLINKDNLPSDELFRATQKVVKKDGQKKDLDFHIFDMLGVDEFRQGKSKKTYTQRRNTLEQIKAYEEVKHNNEKDFNELFENIYILPVLYHGDDKSVIPLLMKKVEEKGLEGVMINTADGLYQAKRTTDLQKVKTMKSADLLVMSVEKSIDGQFEGLLGRVNVEYKGNLVGVGSGFTLEQRKRFIDNPDLIAGKIIEVQFFEESQDEKTGLPSLRFPVFKGIRDDKGVEDINYGE